LLFAHFSFYHSAPAVEAYKKFILVSLIHTGTYDTKRTGNPMMMRNLKSVCSRYVDFANAYATKDPVALTKCATDNAEYFTKDNNFGLINQCMEALGDRQIRALTQTYLTLNLETLASGANVPTKQEAQRRLVAMVDRGTIVASVNEKEGMVSFGESSEQYDDVRTLKAIDGDIGKAIMWGSHMRQMDDQIASSAEYLQRTSGMGERGGMGGGMGFDPEMGGGGMGGFGFEGMGMMG
jgi:COP9 signalosome complex subunit 3